MVVYLLYKRKIMSLFAFLGWWLTRKKRKQFLLDKEDKIRLLKETNNLYALTYNSDEIFFGRKSKELIRSVRLARNYFSSAFNTIDEFSIQESKKFIDKKVINDSLKKAMYLYSESIFSKEKKSIKMSKQELLCFIQETRMLIMITSKLTKEDFNFKATELESISGRVDKAIAMIHNSFLALCFSEALSAQNNYFELLKLYEKMSDKEKALFYKEFSKIYHYTKTVLSWV